MSEEVEDLVTLVVGEQTAEQPPAPATDWPLDEVCAAAVDLARQALLDEVDAAQVGEPLGPLAEGPLVVTHYFAGNVPGYAGWQWAVTVTRAPGSDQVTVDETALLPDGSALLAPPWVPWKHRIESGDLGAGDVMVTEPDDPRLIAGLTDNDLPETEDEVRPPQWELGLGRVRVLSPEGRREAAHRWYREAGPRSPIARAADLQCATCGFLLLIGGPLGQAFGVCANGYSPVDGRVVAMNFGCGAHSETVEKPAVGVAEIVIDEVGYDALPEEPEEPVQPVEPAEPEDTIEPVEAEEPAEPEDTIEPVEAEEPADTAESPAEAEAEQPEDSPAEAEASPEPAERTAEVSTDDAGAQDDPTEEGA